MNGQEHNPLNRQLKASDILVHELQGVESLEIEGIPLSRCDLTELDQLRELTLRFVAYVDTDVPIDIRDLFALPVHIKKINYEIKTFEPVELTLDCSHETLIQIEGGGDRFYDRVELKVRGKAEELTVRGKDVFGTLSLDQNPEKLALLSNLVFQGRIPWFRLNALDVIENLPSGEPEELPGLIYLRARFVLRSGQENKNLSKLDKVRKLALKANSPVIETEVEYQHGYLAREDLEAHIRSIELQIN